MQRRSWIKNTGGLLLGAALPFAAGAGVLEAGAATLAPGDKKPVMRVAHLTDVHLKDKFDAPARFRRCLQHVQSQQPKVDFILNGGSRRTREAAWRGSLEEK